MYQHILLPIDLDQGSSWTHALPQAIRLCELTGAHLHVLTVVPDFGMSAISQYFPAEHRKEVLGYVMTALKAFVKEHVPEGVHVQHVLGEGTVYDVILKIAKQVSADLIVMESNRPEFQDYLLGPNAARVVRHANCSVLVVRE